MNIVKNPHTLYGLRVVQDVDEVVKTLKNGEAVARFEFGDSMSPIFESGQYARLTPLKTTPKVGDAVFCNVNGYWMTHMVWVCNEATKFCLIGSTDGQMFGWTNEILALATPIPYKEIEE